MAEDIWEPIRQGFRDIREGFKEARDSETSKKKVENDRIEKLAKIAKEQGEQAAKDELVKIIGDEGSSVFGGNTRLAQAAAKAGVSLTTFKKEKPKAAGTSGFDYSFVNKAGGGSFRPGTTLPQMLEGDGSEQEAETTEETSSGNPIDTAPAIEYPGAGASSDPGIRSSSQGVPPVNLEDYNYSNMSSINALEGTQKVLLNKQSMVNQALANGAVGTPQEARAANELLKGTQNLLKITNRELSIRQEVDKNYKSAVDQLYKIDPGAAAKVIDNFNKTIVPDLQKAGVPVDVIDGRKQQFVVNYLGNLKTSKSELEAIYKTAYSEADTFDKNFKENEKLYRFAAVADKETLQSMAKDPNLKPYQSNVIISALVTRMMQDQVSAKTGENMSVMTPEQIDQLYTPATPQALEPALDVGGISQAGERIRNAFPKTKPAKGRTPTIQMSTDSKEVPGFRPIRR